MISIQNPIDRVVKVQLSFTQSGISLRTFGKTLFITPDVTLPTTDRLQTFENFTQIESVFTEGSAPYKAGELYFSRTDGTPKAFMVGRWFKTQTLSSLIGGSSISLLSVFQLITDGSFDIVINSERRRVRNLDFSLATSYADVASIVTTELGASSINGGSLTFNLAAFQAITDGSFTINGQDITGLDFSSDISLNAIVNRIETAMTLAGVLGTVTHVTSPDHFDFALDISLPNLTFATPVSPVTGTDISAGMSWTAITGAILTTPTVDATMIFDALGSNFVVNGTVNTPILGYFETADDIMGTDISSLLAMTASTAKALNEEVGPETIGQAFAEFQSIDNTFYFIALDTTERDTTTVTDLASIIIAQEPPNGTAYMYYAESTDPNLINFNLLQAGGSSRIVGDWIQSTQTNPLGSTEYLSVASTALMSITNFQANSGIVNAYVTTRPGIAYSNLTPSQIEEFNTKGINYLINFGGGSSSQTVDPYYLNGTTFQNTIFQDIRYGVDWLLNLLQVTVFNALVSSKYLPRTVEGQTVIMNTMNEALAQAVSFGLIAPGQLSPVALQNYIAITSRQSATGFLAKGYEVFSPPVASELEISRAERMPYPFYFFVKGAGAINGVFLTGFFDQ